MKKQRLVLMFFLIVAMLTLARVPCNAYINQINPDQGPGNTFTKLVSYVDLFKSMGEGAVFAIERDIIHYHETFLDQERDYHGISLSDKLKPNGSLTENKKKNDPIGIQIKYEHDPSVYRNPVERSSLHGQWFDATLSFDTTANKWRIHSDELFTHPGDDKRGEWIIYLRAKDSTTKPLFDKYGTGSAKFRVHKPPVAQMSLSQNPGASTATLTDVGSYDIDGSYKNQQGNYAVDQGIKKREWAAKIGDKWVELNNSNATFYDGGKRVVFNTGGKEVTDFRLTVTDYDDTMTSVSKNSLIYERPSVDFDFKVGSKKTSYVYEGNRGVEIIKVSPLISSNDDAYHAGAGYESKGEWQIRWYGFKSSGGSETASGKVKKPTNGQQSDASFSMIKNATDTFNSKILSQWSALTAWNPKKLEVELQFVNAYDLEASKKKSASVIPITVQDKTVVPGNVHDSTGQVKEFLIGSNVTLNADAFRSGSLGINESELDVIVYAPSIGLQGRSMTRNSNGKYSIQGSIPNNVRDQFTYSFEIRSKRDGLNTPIASTGTYTALVHTPLGVQKNRNNVTIPEANRPGRLNGSRATKEITTDEPFKIEIETYEYAKTVHATFEYPVKDAKTGVEFAAGVKVPLNKVSENASSKKWERELIYPTSGVESSGESEIQTSLTFIATAENGRDVETDKLTFKLLSYKLENFRVVQIKDFQLSDFYKNNGTGKFDDVDMDVNKMGIDGVSFVPYPLQSLAKGYKFEFEIDSRNFNKDVDTIVITPSFYAINGNSRDSQAKLAYWIDSNKQVRRLGTGAHAKYNQIVLTKDNRTITGSLNATWRGEYYIPGTTFLTNPGTTEATAKANALDSDIIVNFNIEGYKNGVPKFNYNVKQWGVERTVIKNPYLIGDVIRYGSKTNLDDLEIVRPR